MKVTFHGHATVSIETNEGTRLMIDPFINGNPLSDLEVANVKVDYLLITHGHNDHLGDMVEIAKNNDATIIACPEILSFAEAQGVNKTHGMNLGGSFDFPFGRVKMVNAQHSSGYEFEGQTLYFGEPAGFLLTIENKRIYHAGDTAYFSDMALVKDEGEIDLAFLPIGDNFTMGINDAVKASNRIESKKTVPIHFNTFPVIQQDPQTFVELLPKGVGQVLEAGETIEL